MDADSWVRCSRRTRRTWTRRGELRGIASVHSEPVNNIPRTIGGFGLQRGIPRARASLVDIELKWLLENPVIDCAGSEMRSGLTGDEGRGIFIVR
jgi:hypothetical protein